MSHPIDDMPAGDHRERCIAVTRGRRRAFTLVEMLIAASITALVATAGTTLIFAVASGTTQTRGVRGKKAVGQYALARIGRTIRQSRAIGGVTSSSVTLWAIDLNQDDVVNADELGFIDYDPIAKQVLYRALDPTSGIDPALVISQTAFVDSTQLLTLVPNSAKIAVVWANGIESFVLTGYPSLTETRIVGTWLTIGAGDEEVAYQSTASPRASADYLFVPQAVLPSDGPSGRQRRRSTSRWDGYGDILSDLAWTEPIAVF